MTLSPTNEERAAPSTWSPLVLAVLAVVVLLAGCTGDDADEAGSVPDAASDVPPFAGPWAADFTLMYSRAGSDFERTVLADEVIDDRELADVRTRYTACLEAFGFTHISFSASGFEFDAPEGNDPDTVNSQVGECSDESGDATIGTLASWISRNPDNLDEDAIVAACLVRTGAVEPGYSAEQFAEDEPDLDFPYLDGFGDAAFTECNADPLDLF